MPWINDAILKQRKELARLRKRLLNKPNPKTEAEYKTHKKEYNKQLISNKQNYFRKKITDAGSDSKKIWEVINQVIIKKTKETKTNQAIRINGNETTQPTLIANTLNNYYKNAAYNLTKAIEPGHRYTDFLPKVHNNNTFNFDPQLEGEVYDTILTLKPKHSAGHDGIPNKLLCLAANTLKKPLTHIINKSFNEATFPEALKTAKITPIHKGGEHAPENYRPINLLSVFSKVIEKTVKNQLTQHMDLNHENNNQFGFKANNQTAHPLILTRDYIEKQTLQGNFTILILMDLSKAFDTINTNLILPTKLAHYGLTKSATNWFNTYLENRSQYVNWCGTNSETIDLHPISVVQGSNIGPTLFNIYIQDLQSHTKLKTIQFADDTNFLLSHHNLDQLINEANQELKKISAYMAANQLLVNRKKTQYLIFKPKGKSNTTTKNEIKIGDSVITQTDCARFLGIKIDDKLNFNNQYKYVLGKLKSAIKALICTRTLLKYRGKIAIYYALFQPHIDYCAVAWLDKLNKKK